MKFRHVKELLIGAAGMLAVGGTATGDAAKQAAIQAPDTEPMVNEVAAPAVKTEMPEIEVKEKIAVKAVEPELIEEETEPEEELVIATVDNYLNIRSEASLEGEVIGKLYNHSVGVLTEETDDGWYHITSGTVDGYVKGDYVKRGEEGAMLAEEVGTRLAKVDTTTLRVREEPTTESRTMGLLPDGEILEVSEEEEGWAKVSVEEGEGYVSTDYVEVYTENTVAESKEEEEARLLREEEERRAAWEAAKQEQERLQAQENAKREQERQQAQESAAAQQVTRAEQTNRTEQNVTTPAANGNAQSTTGAGEADKKPAETGNTAAGSDRVETNGTLGRQIADYALQFVGNPYVYGGTSLTNGADCSGFVMSVYKQFGISLPRTSGEQGQCGSSVGSLEAAKPGDLIWYSGHIGIYIGNGQIVHASSPKNGIRVSNAAYRNILSIRRIV